MAKIYYRDKTGTFKPLELGAVIDDNRQTSGSTWSSQKIQQVIDEIRTGKDIVIAGNTVSYTNQTPIPEKVGGIEKGATFNSMPIEEVLNMLLYPYQAPSFSSFGITGNTNLEIGQEFTPINMSWSIANANNVRLNTITALFNDTTITLQDDQKTAIGNNISMIGAQAVRKNIPGSVTATIKATNNRGKEFSRSVNVSWNYKIFKVIKATDSLEASDITGEGNFATSFNGIHSFPSGGGYEFLVYPAAWGTINPSKVKDASTGLAFAVVTNHPEITLNRNGVNVQYKVLRSTNWLGSPSSMLIG